MYIHNGRNSMDIENSLNEMQQTSQRKTKEFKFKFLFW